MTFLDSLLNTPLSIWVQASSYGYYILLVGHAIGMAVVVGAVAMLCIRVLGFARAFPLLQFEPLLRLAAAGFALNFLTGAALFMANAVNLAQNPPFLIKIGFVLLGGVGVAGLWRRVMRERAVLIDGAGPPSIALKAIACVTLGSWLMAILAGRLIAYTIKY